MNYLAVVDLDGFKQVNDTYGHEAGDYVLIEVAKRLSEHTNSLEQVYRLGGDEFAILLHADDELSLRRKCKSFLNFLRRPYVYKGQSLFVSASIGVTACHKADLETCLKQADLAMYRVKHRDKTMSPYIEQIHEKNLEYVDHNQVMYSRFFRLFFWSR